MKTNAISFAICIAVVAISALPRPAAEARFCWRIGQPCSKLRRSVEIASSISNERSAEPLPEARFCWRKGQPCSKAKRAEDVLTIALADTNINGHEALTKHSAEPRFCWRMGQPCSKTKRSTVSQSALKPELEAKTETKILYEDPNLCRHENESCANMKRLTEALVHTIAEPEPDTWLETKAKARFCWQNNRLCSKFKRDANAKARFCWREGLPCLKSKELDQSKGT